VANEPGAPPQDDLAAQAAARVVEDASPRLRRGILRMGGLRALDAALLVAVNRLPHISASDEYIGLLSDLGRGVGWVGLAAVVAWRGGGRGRRAGIRSSAAMLLANGLAQGPIKHLVLRRRPFHDRHDHIVVGVRTLDTSFPSGHTSGSFAAATSLLIDYPRYAPALLAVAAAVGFSRVYLGHHYPSDVAGGALLGSAVGLLSVAVDRGLEKATG
jgi:undecaprenyl-diphosphatase